MLLLCGLAAAVLAWAYFYVLQDKAFIGLLLISNVGLILENRSLRKKKTEDNAGR